MAFEDALRQHDEHLNRLHLNVWVGAEPTFTLRHAETPEWLTEALGPTKESYAQRQLAALYAKLPKGSLILRTVGRQYPKETLPRWSIGLYRRRDGNPLWQGPLDPLITGESCRDSHLEALWLALADGLMHQGKAVRLLRVRTEAGHIESLRLLFRTDGQAISTTEEVRWQRPPLHTLPIPPLGLRDDLAIMGLHLLILSLETLPSDTDHITTVSLELPAFASVEQWLHFLKVVEEATQQAHIPSLIFRGFPPPVAAHLCWDTFTPDPAVIEINTTPHATTHAFFEWNRTIYTAAQQAGLSPYRLHYNGQYTDSGGGGQITLGGPTPQDSPFFIYPNLLPTLISYVNRHPALSFYFAPDYVGGSSQLPRPDEGSRDLFAELALAQAALLQTPQPTPELIWQSLSPFLVDGSGNAHRSEINIEKLWNPYLPGRGQLGLVEFRTFRMAPTPEKLAALAVLLRSVIAMLSQRVYTQPFIHWSNELHDRFALPFYLQQDLQVVFTDLAQAGVGLAAPLSDLLMEDSYYCPLQTDFSGVHLTVRKALEFWPLIGDLSTQEQGGSRLVDASTARLEIRLEASANQGHHTSSPIPINDWQIAVQALSPAANTRSKAVCWRLPLRTEQQPHQNGRPSTTRLIGIRYRRFKPWHGLHPTLAAQDPLILHLLHPNIPNALRITLHEWKPEGGGYAGLPADLKEAEERRQQRFVIETNVSKPTYCDPIPQAITPYTVDLRWMGIL